MDEHIEAALMRAGAQIEAAQRENAKLTAEVAALRGLKPELPPRPPHNNDASHQPPGLPRYGLRSNGPGQPYSVPMADGYWTPFHLALAEVEALRTDAERFRFIRMNRLWLKANLLMIAAPEFDAAIDAARAKKGPADA